MAARSSSTLLHRLTRHLNHNINAPQYTFSPHRTFSISSASYTQDDINRARFVRFFAGIFMLTAGIRVAPWAAANSVDHCIKLMDIDSDTRFDQESSAFLVKSGISRLALLSHFESARLRAIDSGAIPRLERIMDQHSDETVREAAQNALHQMKKANVN